MKNRLLMLGVAIVLAYFNVLSCKIGPDFLVIGVTKCGTTSLYNWMVQHPKIHSRAKKEIHFFDGNYNKGFGWYNRHFSKKQPGQLSGEATPGYFWKKACLPKVAKYCQGTKLILICRNPVKRVISEYFRLKRRGEEKLPFDQAIARAYNFGRYLGAGCYSEHLARWLSFFPRKDIHIMFLEELAVAPERELNKVFGFLGLKNYRINSYEPRNKATYDASQIRPETIRYLEKFYEPFNQKFAKMLGRKLPW
ncbi:sulfotransferase domain-containing protein [Candidatus Dependentiae bacterium]|nr:sulfotransferase domain-containing protein [Candidatus Dependentiae bacterium]